MQRRLATIDVRADEGRTSLPVIECVGDAPGPTLIFTANIHGDEVAGTVAVHALSAWLGDHQRAGRVVLYPTLNPGGLASCCREEPTTAQDLNRGFPKGGTGLAGAIARALWRDIVARQPELLVDLHSDSALAIPYAIVDRAVLRGASERIWLEREARTAAEVAGVTVVHEFVDDDYRRYGLERSLSGAVMNHLGKPAITIEAGGRRVAEPRAVAALVAACSNVIAQRGLVPESMGCEVPGLPGRWRRSLGPRSTSAGLWVPLFAPGDDVEPGEVIGVIRSAAGRVLQRPCAVRGGVVLSWREGAWIEPGQICGTFAVEEGDG